MAGALFSFDADGWHRRADLPPFDLRAQRSVTVGIADGRPVVVTLDDAGNVASFAWDGEKGWSDFGAARSPRPPRDVRLLDVDGAAVLWLAADAGPGAILRRSAEGWGSPVELQPPPGGIPAGPLVDATVAMHRLRLVASPRPGELFEQAYDLDGKPAGTVAQGVVPAGPAPWGNAVQLGVMGLLAVVMMTTLHRRGTLQEAMRRADPSRTAPFGLRLGAGLVDALPVFVTLAVLRFTATADDFPARLEQAVPLTWVLASVGVYVLHTAATEALTGRSVGKYLFGLRVVSLTGERPAAWQAATRNVLRAVDVFLLFPLSLVVFSPLRQRVGDLVAGTMVVFADPDRRRPKVGEDN